MKKIRVLNQFNKIRINKRLKLKNRNIFDKYGIKTNNFLGYIDLFYNLKDEMPDFDNFNDEINLRFKLFKERINNFSNRNIIVEKIKKEYVNESNRYKKKEIHKHIDSKSRIENYKEDYFNNSENIKSEELNNIVNRNTNWINSYERRSFENITFNRSGAQNNRRENKIYLNKYYGDLKNHLWVKNIGELYRNEISAKETYSNRMIDIKQYPFLEKRIIGRKVIKNYWNKNTGEVGYQDIHSHREIKISKRVEYKEFKNLQRNFKNIKMESYLNPFKSYWRNIEELRATKIRNNLTNVKNHFIENIDEMINGYKQDEIFLSYKARSENILENNIYKNIKNNFGDKSVYEDSYLFSKDGEVNLENRILKFNRDILGENIVFIDKNNYKIFGGENNVISKQSLWNYGDYGWNYYGENEFVNEESKFVENLRENLNRSSSNSYSRYHRNLFQNILNSNIQRNILEDQIFNNAFNYVSMESINRKNINGNFNVSKEAYFNHGYVEKIMLKQYLKSIKRNGFNENITEEYYGHEEINNSINLNRNIISNAYAKYLSSLINMGTSLTSNTNLNIVREKYSKGENYNYKVYNSKFLRFSGQESKKGIGEDKWIKESFKVKEIRCFNSKLFNSLNVKNLIKKIWNKSESSQYKLLQNSDVVYRMNEKFEEINEEINELRLGNEIIISNNKRLSRSINNEDIRVFFQKYLREYTTKVNQRDEMIINYREEKKHFMDINREFEEKNVSVQFNNEIQNYIDLLKRQEKIIDGNNTRGMFNAFKQEEFFYRIHNEVFQPNERTILNTHSTKKSLESIEKVESQIYSNEDNSKHLHKNFVDNNYSNNEYNEIQNEERYETFIERVQKLIKSKIFPSREIINNNDGDIFVDRVSAEINKRLIKNGNSYKSNYFNSVLQRDIHNYEMNNYWKKTAVGNLVEEVKEIINYELHNNYNSILNKAENNYKSITNIVNTHAFNRFESDIYKQWNNSRNAFKENSIKNFEPLYKKDIYEIFKSNTSRVNWSYLENVSNFFRENSNRWIFKKLFSRSRNKNSIVSFVLNRQNEKNIYAYNNQFEINEIEKKNIISNKNPLEKNIELNIQNNYVEDRMKNIQNNIQNNMTSNRIKYLNASGPDLNKSIYNIIKNRGSSVHIKGEVKENLSKENNIKNFNFNSIKNKEDITAYNIDEYNSIKYYKNNLDKKKYFNSHESLNRYSDISLKETNNLSEKILNENVINKETSIKNQVDKLEENFNEIREELEEKNIHNSIKINSDIKKIQSSTNINSANVKNQNFNFNYRNEENLLSNINNIRDLSRGFIKDVEVLNTTINPQKFIKEEKIKNEILKNNKYINERNEYFGESNRDENNTTVFRNGSLIEGNSIKSSVINNIDKVESIQRNIKQIQKELNVYGMNVKLDGNSSYKKILRNNITNIIKSDKKFIGKSYLEEIRNNKKIINGTKVFDLKEKSLISKLITPFNGYKKNILRMSNVNAGDKSISLNVKNSNGNYENHTFKQVKNVILSNDGKDIENNYDYATEIIFKKEETKINQEEIIKMISENQKNMEIEMRSIIDKKIKKQGEEINVPTLSSQVYRDIERKMKYEKRRKGMI